MLKIQDTIDNHSKMNLMPPAAASELRECCDAFLISYSRTHNHAVRVIPQQKLFNMDVPKLHYMWHLCYRAQYLSLRRECCLIDEAYMQHMKTLAKACTCSNHLHAVPNSLIKKYKHGMYIDHTVEAFADLA